MVKATLIITLAIVLVNGCTGQHTETATVDNGPEQQARQPAVEMRKMTEPSMPKLPTKVPEAMLRQMIEQASRDSGLEVDQITTERAEKVTWRSGAMGCPQPDLMYTQALVNGYWVVLRAGDEEYDFRAGTNGKFQRCQSKTKQTPIPYDDT